MNDSQYYHLKFILPAIAFMPLGAITLWLILHGWILFYLPLIILVGYLLIKLQIKQADHIPNQVNYFLRSLINEDFMTQYPATRDTGLNSMYKDMNRIIDTYRDRLQNFEYKQHYQERLQRIVTHELRNSIAPIIVLSNDMLTAPERYTPERIRQGMKVVHRQCVSVKNFLDEFHQLTNLPLPTKKEVSIEELFGQLQALLAHPSLHFSWGHAVTLTADMEQLILVLTNLIKNAREATEGLPDAHIEVTASESNGEAYISVTDNGPGIPEDMTEKIFLPFYTTKTNGSGIGLCLSRQIMRQHGGDLTLHNHHGKGTMFMLTFSIQ